jgi:ribonuclease VapC
MSRVVVDTSVVMCALLREPGLERAQDLCNGAFMSSVSVAETIAKCLEKEVPEELALLFLASSEVAVVDFDLEHAKLAGRLWGSAPRGKLSLGDRACIATAIRLDASVATADRIWAGLGLPCAVELIR